jgi:Cytochrome c554 and c-prime
LRRAELTAAAVLLASQACSGAGSPTAPAAAVRSSPPAAMASAPAWQTRGPGGMVAIEAGAASAELLDASSCAGCHVEQHREWAGSRHGAAWRNSIFQREYSEKPRAWCANCHAPLSAQQRALARGDSRLADQGVSCAACHVRRGALVSRRRAATSPHATVVDGTFGSPAMCADCHEFTFPVMRPRDGVALRMTEHPMQSTVSDFLAGPFAAEPAGCLACHATRYGHGFPGGHDLGMLRGAVAASWCRDADAVVMEVANVGAGHRVPTGDIHRHLVARLWRASAPEALFEAFFGRRYQLAPDGGKQITWDSTLRPGQRRRFAVPVAKLAGPASDDAAGPGAPDDDEPLSFEVTYIYTIDEFPRRGRAPAEPVTAQLLAERKRFAALAPCEGSPATAPRR